MHPSPEELPVPRHSAELSGSTLKDLSQIFEKLSGLASPRHRPALHLFKNGRTRLGPLLQQAMDGMKHEGQRTGMARLAMDMAAPTGAPAELPVALAVPRIHPEPDEKWPQYKARAADIMGGVSDVLKRSAGLQCSPVFSANVLRTKGGVDQIEAAVEAAALDQVEFDPLLRVVSMDDALQDIAVNVPRLLHPSLTGAGVRIAVLDSGIDVRHPYLQVTDSVTTCGESVEIPGSHGTHVAGSIASRDSVYGGVAPDAVLLNIKVLTSLGYGTSTMITKGIDEALDRGVDVISMSLGFNHLPSWSDGGHGWSCPTGNCPLCLAVNNATVLENVCVFVAAGNEHARANALRATGSGGAFDTEICCPGQAAGAITVAAHTKRTYLVAGFSSRGPTAFQSPKPDMSAPGVNITSTIPVRRDAQGNPVANLSRAELTGQKSGTSMATPIVAGAAALLIQHRRALGQATTPAEIRQDLLQMALAPIGGAPEEVGSGRLCFVGLP